MTHYAIDLDWTRIHAAAIAVDSVRGQIGYDGIVDVFGGSYYAPSFEGRGLAGAICILQAAQKLQHAAWDLVHSANIRLRAAKDSPRRKQLLRHWKPLPSVKELVIQQTQSAAKVALALDELFAALAPLHARDPRQAICGRWMDHQGSSGST